jgi:hypothetical protein
MPFCCVLARIIYVSATPTVDMNLLPDVLGCSFDEGTCPERSEGGQAHPATYHSGTPRNRHPVVARWHAHPLRARCAPLSPASGFPVTWSRDSN